MSSNINVRSKQWIDYKLKHENKYRNLTDLKERMEFIEKCLIAYNTENKKILLKAGGNGMSAGKPKIKSNDCTYFIRVGGDVLLDAKFNKISAMIQLGHELSHIYNKDLVMSNDLKGFLLDAQCGLPKHLLLLNILSEVRSDITGVKLASAYSKSDKMDFFFITRYGEMSDTSVYKNGYLSNNDRVKIAKTFCEYNNKVVKEVFKIISTKYDKSVTYEKFINSILSKKLFFNNLEIKSQWVLDLLQDDNLGVFDGLIFKKDNQLREIIDYYIELSGIKKLRPDVDFNYGGIRTFDDSTIKRESTINAKVLISEDCLKIYTTEKLKKLQENNSLKAKRCMHMLIAHEIGHLFYCDNWVDRDMYIPTNFMRMVSVLRELRADIFGANLIINGKYANELQLNSALAVEDAFYFVPMDLNDEKLGYPDKQRRIYYAYTYGILGSGVTKQAIVDMIIRYCRAYEINVKDFKEKLETKIKRVTMPGKKSWYSRWLECTYLAEQYLRNIR